MEKINEDNLILEKYVFDRSEIEWRMNDGGFNSISRFELFIWDLEMFLQIQQELGDKIILKGGAATQFYLPITAQRTSVDIDMLCLASKEEVKKAIEHIEKRLGGESNVFKFVPYEPQNPRINLEDLNTYHIEIPSICNESELFITKGHQHVKIEFLYTQGEYLINKIREPELFALETEKVFNVLALEQLFADKLTTLGPNTIGIPNNRIDEQFKQVYDVVSLFISNIEHILGSTGEIKKQYEKVARVESEIHNIEYNFELIYEDMQVLIKSIEAIEEDKEMLQRALDFQGLYLRRIVNRDKDGWAIVAFQIDLLVQYIFEQRDTILMYDNVVQLLKSLEFENIRGPEKGKMFSRIRTILRENFGTDKSDRLFVKKFDRIIWEVLQDYDYQILRESLSEILAY